MRTWGRRHVTTQCTLASCVSRRKCTRALDAGALRSCVGEAPSTFMMGKERATRRGKAQTTSLSLFLYLSLSRSLSLSLSLLFTITPRAHFSHHVYYSYSYRTEKVYKIDRAKPEGGPSPAPPITYELNSFNAHHSMTASRTRRSLNRTSYDCFLNIDSF